LNGFAIVLRLMVVWKMMVVFNDIPNDWCMWFIVKLW
jgi:hypothetical protein